MKSIFKLFFLTSFLFYHSFAFGQMPDELRAKITARAAAFEIKGERLVLPGNELSHNTAGYAKIMCSAIFNTGLSPEFATENVGYFTAPYADRAKVGKPVVDYKNKTVSITLPNGITRTTIYTGDQGCVCLAEGSNSLQFGRVKVIRRLPDAATTLWPMGDVLPANDIPAEVD